MIDKELLDSIRIIVLAETDGKTYNAWYDSLCRWYSREFHTPLIQVEELPEEKVFKTFFADVYWKMKNGDEQQQNQFNELVNSALIEHVPEIQEELAKIDEEDDEWEREEYEKELRKLNAELAKNPNKINESEEDEMIDMTVDNPNLRDELQAMMDESDWSLDEE